MYHDRKYKPLNYSFFFTRRNSSKEILVNHDYLLFDETRSESGISTIKN